MYTIFGSGLDAVLFAAYLAERDIDFELVTTSGRIGGYFQGASDCKESPTDLGMVLLEPNDFNAEQKPLNLYLGESGHNARAFISKSYQHFFPSPESMSKVQIQTRINNDWFGSDYFISDDLTMFADANPNMEKELSDRIQWVKENPEWHPRRKLDSDSALGSVDIETAYRKIYGDSIYEQFFSGFIANFLGEKTHLLPARSHRRIWVPMFWPETVQNAIINGPQSRKIYKPEFYTPTMEGSVAGWIHNLSSRIKKTSNVLVLDEQDFKVAVGNNKDKAESFAFVNHTIFEEFETSIKTSETSFSQIKIIHACVSKTLSKLCFVNNFEVDLYRYSFQERVGSDSSSAIFEFGESAHALTESQILESVDNVLKNHGLHRICETKSFNSRFPVNPNLSEQRAVKNINCVNWQVLSDSKSQSLNDNIVRAAWAIDRIE